MSSITPKYALPLTEEEMQILHELAMDYRGAVIVTNEWDALLRYINKLRAEAICVDTSE